MHLSLDELILIDNCISFQISLAITRPGLIHKENFNKAHVIIEKIREAISRFEQENTINENQN